MKISIYNPNKIDEIKQVFVKAFSDSEGESEGLLIGNIAYELMTGTVSHDFYCFVATENEQVIGSIIFSKLSFDNKIKAFLLSPVAISTSHQRRGVGKKLIEFGLNFLKKDGVELAVTYGDPKFYTKIGFKLITEKLIKAPFKLTYPGGWLGQSLVSGKIEPITGNSYCVEALSKPDIW